MSDSLHAVKKELKKLAPAITALSRKIFENPELCYAETFAAEQITAALSKEGFKIKLGKGKLKTAFSATYRGANSKPTVALISEYDALPNLGHACGHNLIAASAFGAAVAIKRALGKQCGTLKVIGTPAEEGGGGKLLMIKNGWFKGVSAALMAHPSCNTRAVARMLAVTEFEFRYHGKASHASAYPEKGINALDAVVILFNSVSAMRQQTPAFSRVHGIILKGGDAPNIIPEFASAKFMVRGLTMPDFRVMKKKIIECAKGAAQATGCRLEILEEMEAYEPFEPNRALGKIYSRHMKSAGLKDSGISETADIGSSDIGNLSQVVPSLHPEYSVGDGKAVNHSREFLKAVLSKKGEANMMKATTALAATVAELFSNPDLLNKISREFQTFKKRNR